MACTASPDAAQLAPQSGKGSSPLTCRIGSCGHRFRDHGHVVVGNRLGHTRCELALLTSRGELTDPDRRFAARLDHLIGKPLELLPVARIQRQGGQAVEHCAAPSRRSFRQSALRGVDGSRGSRYAKSTHAVRLDAIGPNTSADGATTVAQLALCSRSPWSRCSSSIAGWCRLSGSWSRTCWFCTRRSGGTSVARSLSRQRLACRRYRDGQRPSSARDPTVRSSPERELAGSRPARRPARRPEPCSSIRTARTGEVAVRLGDVAAGGCVQQHQDALLVRGAALEAAGGVEGLGARIISQHPCFGG